MGRQSTLVPIRTAWGLDFMFALYGGLAVLMTYWTSLFGGLVGWCLLPFVRGVVRLAWAGYRSSVIDELSEEV